MLQLYNLNKEKIEGLTKYKDLKIESTLSTGDKVLSFSYPKKYSNNIIEEGYIRTKEAEFVIKQVDKSLDSWVNVTCNLNVEELESMVEDFNSTEQTIESCINFALVGTGWRVRVDSSIIKRRTVRKTNSSIWDIIQQAKKTYRVEIEFDTINKIVLVKEKIGGDKGVYFTDELNLKTLSIQSNSYDFYTRILAIGKDDLKVEVENYNYSNKRKALIWKDERYTDETSLREDAILKLEEISKPYRSYSAEVIDLAKLNENYKDILSYKLGDTITLISKDNRIREKQRIVKTVEYPDNPEENTVEIANTTLSFEDIQKEFQETSDTVNNITEDDGTISEGAIKVAVEKLTIDKVSTGTLEAELATIGELLANKVETTELSAIYGDIKNLKADKANITDLTATNIKFDVASGGTLDLQTLLAKHITGENGQFLNITSSNTVIANAVIKDAMIENISVSKLLAGTISTNKFTVASDDGGITIVGPTMQFKDKNNKVRIQMGQDTQGNFNFILRGEDGTTTLIDHTGIKEKAIADDLIKSNMVAADAIGEKQINYSSLITGLNKDTNTSLIKASKVAIDLTGQSLEVSFNSLKSNVEEIEIGGRNLYSKSKTIIEILSNKGMAQKDVSEAENGFKFTSNGSIHARVRCIEKGIGQYTISFYIKSSADSYIQIDLNDLGYKGINVTNTYQKIVHTINNTREYSAIYNFIDFESRASSGVEFFVKDFKVETGTKVTDWTPAPEDVDSKIEANTTNITVAQGKIEGLISENTIIKGDVTTISDKYTSLKATVDGINTTVASHTSSIGTINTNLSGLSGKVTTIENNYSSLSQDLNGFKTTVSNTYSTKTELSGVDGKVTSLTSRVSTAESSITQLNNKIALKVESTEVNTIVDNAINNVQIGGRNLIRKSTIGGTNTTDVFGGTNAYYRDISKDQWRIANWTVHDIGTYSLSFWAKAATSGTLQVDLCDQNLTSFTITTSWQKFTMECKYVNSGWLSNTYFGFIDFNGGALGTLYLSNIKLEYGTKSTDWSAAPEDIDSSISTVSSNVTTVSNKVASIETNLNSITSRVSSTESSITTINGNISSLQSRMSSAEQKITSDAIIATVSNTISTAKQEAINSANSTTDSKLSNYATTSSLTQTANSITALFRSTGGKNFIKNSSFLKDTSFWSGLGNSYIRTIQNKKYLSTNIPNGGQSVITQNISASDIQIPIDGKMYLSAEVYTGNLAYECSGFGAVVWYTDGTINDYTWNGFTQISHTGTYDYIIGKNINIDINKTLKSIDIRLWTAGSWSGNNNGASYTKIILTAGETYTPWTPHPSEIYEGSTIIDASGVTIKNGALTVQNNAGATVLQGDVNGNLIMVGTLITKGGNNKAVELNGPNMYLYDWEGTTRTEPVGNVFSGKRIINGSTTSIPGFVVANHVNAYLAFGYQRSGTSYGDYILLDKNGMAGQGTSFPIWVQENCIFNSPFIGIRNPDNGTYNRIWNSVGNILVSEISTTKAGEGFQIQTTSGSALFNIIAGRSYPIGLNTSTQVSGNFTVTGSKNSLQETENYGQRLINALESAEYYYSDLGFGKINSDGECYIRIDDILQECVNLDCKYHVFTQTYNGSITRIDRQREYFIVYGEPNTEFSWQYIAKRLGYENVRLDTPDIGTVEEYAVFNDEDLKAKTTEDTLLDVLTFDLENLLMEG